MKGGVRPGAGRKKGVVNKLTAAVNAKIKARVQRGGESPLDIIMDAARAFITAANRLGDGTVIVNEKAITRLTLLERAAELAKHAAPYLHPKLVAVEQSGPDGGPVQHQHNVTVRWVEK